MKKEIKSTLKKTVKIGGVTCAAVGAVALITSGAALKAITEGGNYLLKTVEKIVKESPVEEKIEIVEESVEETMDKVPEEAAEEPVEEIIVQEEI